MHAGRPALAGTSFRRRQEAGLHSSTRTLHGLTLESEWTLPDWVPHEEAQSCQVELRLGPVTPGSNFLVQADSKKFQLDVPGICRFRAEGGRTLWLDPHPEASALDVNLFLLHSAWPALMLQRGYLPVMGCCLRLEGKTVLLAGHTSAGKSTLAAWLYKAGGHVLGDDIVYLSPRLHQVVVRPGLPWLTLWLDVLTELEIPLSDCLPLRAPRADASHRHRWPLDPPASDFLDLDEIIFLDSHNLPQIQREELSADQSAELLFNHCVHVIFAGEMNKRSALGLLASAAARQCRCWDLRRPNQPLSKEALEELAGAARDRS